ncbi:MAG: MotA/TolQ/ExbB proton channel family protein [Desulfobacterales bacterium]|nr:MotA/TolQ/ExbB proton channel family protein [Desulfobacterales bacterium]
MRSLITPFIISLMIFSITGPAAAEALSDPYMKEYTFLKAQKEELAQRLEKEKAQQAEEIAKARREVQSLQDRQVALSNQLQQKELAIEKAQQKLQDTTSNKEIINSVIVQAKAGLEKYGIEVDDTAESKVDTMNRAFLDSANLYQNLSSIHAENGRFYLLDGTSTSGEIVKIGNIAAYGISAKQSGALAPAGNGEYKLWNQPGSSDDAKALYGREMPEMLDIFVYENMDQDVAYQEEKTVADTMESGGVIGYIILGLGISGLLLILARVLFLLRAGSRVKRITRIVYKEIENGKGAHAYDAVKDFKGSTARVIRATLRNITADREHIEDIITESILNENRALDRFSNFILVIAAVAPLLGLLGTVTGMINTFDIITVYGTGDPKLLSGGISEALVTTMLGLMVAIPLLLLGNLSNGWAENIKDSMEQSALHVVNLYEKYSTAS